jgi:hypothetical protein
MAGMTSPRFRSDLYHGTAGYYDSYRLAYPAGLIDGFVASTSTLSPAASPAALGRDAAEFNADLKARAAGLRAGRAVPPGRHLRLRSGPPSRLASRAGDWNAAGVLGVAVTSSERPGPAPVSSCAASTVSTARHPASPSRLR